MVVTVNEKLPDLYAMSVITTLKALTSIKMNQATAVLALTTFMREH